MDKKDRRKTLFFLSTVIAILVGILAACTTPATQPADEREAPVAEAPLEVQRVSLEESKTAFDSGSAVFLDVRSEAAYEASHIPGARSVPLQFLEPRLGELDPDQWIITYCT